MTNTEQIIKDAIEGGWELPMNFPNWRVDLVSQTLHCWESDFEKTVNDLGMVFLDPLFWQAVGKTRGWDTDKGWREGDGFEINCTEADFRWHQFIDYLADGDDYETALSKLV